jgi:hypothetical protein
MIDEFTLKKLENLNLIVGTNFCNKEKQETVIIKEINYQQETVTPRVKYSKGYTLTTIKIKFKIISVDFLKKSNNF